MRKEKILEIEGINSKIVLRKHKQSKRLKISIYPDGEIFVTFPRYIPYFMAEKMVLRKSEWIEQKLKEISGRDNGNFKLGGSVEEYAKLKNKAFVLVKEKIEKFKKIYGLKTGSISVRNQKTRWGSCSAKGNLNFNYKIVLLPEKMADYIIVHELCHLKEFNHSKRFWDLVGKTVPDFLSIRKNIRKL